MPAVTVQNCSVPSWSKAWMEQFPPMTHWYVPIGFTGPYLQPLHVATTTASTSADH